MERRTFLSGLAAAAVLGSCATLRRSAGFRSQRISVETRGSGPDVVLIPGLATSRSVWAATVAALPGFRYHLVEVAGFNGTDPMGNRTAGPIIRPLAEEIARYIREERLVRPALVGRVLVVDMLPFNGMNFGGLDATVASVAAMAPAARQRYFGDDPGQTRQNTESLYAAFIHDPAARAEILPQALSSDREVSGRIFEETFSLDLRNEIGAIRAPLTVVYTRAPNQRPDNDRTDEMYRLAYRATPQAKLKRVEESGHFIMLDQPQRFQAAMREFLGS